MHCLQGIGEDDNNKNYTLMDLYKYSGAGNDFIAADGRGTADLGDLRSADRISALCSRTEGVHAPDGRVGADGLLIVTDPAPGCDFCMEYYNADGSGGMMCGNGGRCIVAFADFLGIPRSGDTYLFEAADGLHAGTVLSKDGNMYGIRLKMVDASDRRELLGGTFLNTGTRHFVKMVDDVKAVDVETEGKSFRWNEAFAPQGANANFVSRDQDGTFSVRTFEKGVEAETLACGTGITACAIALYGAGVAPNETEADGRVIYRLHALGGDLSVDFKPAEPAVDVYLTGPAELVGHLNSL